MITKKTSERQNKKVYKVGSKYFNIDQLREVSEIYTVNPVYSWRSKANAYAYMTRNDYDNIVNLRQYDSNCRSIHVTIDGTDYSQINYEEEDCGEITLVKVTDRQKQIFDKFKTEAEELLNAFIRR